MYELEHTVIHARFKSCVADRAAIDHLPRERNESRPIRFEQKVVERMRFIEDRAEICLLDILTLERCGSALFFQRKRAKNGRETN